MCLSIQNGFSDSMPMSISCLISLQNSMKSSRQWMRAFQPSLSRARAYCGKILHHGIVNGIRIVRIFRTGKARYDKRIMDEHLSILDGKTIEMKHQFVDDNRLTIGQFTIKHENYASREAAILLDAEYHLSDTSKLEKDHGEEVEKKRAQKAKYAKMPLFWRAFGYFIYRYIVKGGWLF